jgi:hypothetical protein
MGLMSRPISRISRMSPISPIRTTPDATLLAPSSSRQEEELVPTAASEALRFCYHSQH